MELVTYPGGAPPSNNLSDLYEDTEVIGSLDASSSAFLQSSSDPEYYFSTVNGSSPEQVLIDICNSYNESGNGTFGDDEQKTFSITSQIAIYILYNAVFLAAVLGNVLVCYVVFSSPRMRTVTNYLIANLALGDLFMAVLCVPFSYIPVIYQYWPFGRFLCHVLSPAQAVCVFVSAYTLVALAGDRYMAILYPLRPRLRRSQAIIVIFLVWAIAIFTATPIAIFTRLNDTDPCNIRCEEEWGEPEWKLYYSLALMLLQYFFPLLVLIFTYTRIAVAVWGKRAPGEAEDGRDRRLAKSKRKTVVMMVVVVAGYTLAWLPLNAMNLVLDLVPSIVKDPPASLMYIYLTCHWLAMAHTTYNPLIYAWINSRFRSAFKATLSKVKCSFRCCSCCPCPDCLLPFFSTDPNHHHSQRHHRHPRGKCSAAQALVGYGKRGRNNQGGAGGGSGGSSNRENTLTTCVGSSFSESLTALRRSQTPQHQSSAQSNTNHNPIWT